MKLTNNTRPLYTYFDDRLFKIYDTMGVYDWCRPIAIYTGEETEIRRGWPWARYTEMYRERVTCFEIHHGDEIIVLDKFRLSPVGDTTLLEQITRAVRKYETDSGNEISVSIVPQLTQWAD